MKRIVLNFDQDLLIFIIEPDPSVSESDVNSNRSSRIASPCVNSLRNTFKIDQETQSIIF